MLSVKESGIKYHFFESLIWLNQGLNPGLPHQWQSLYSLGQCDNSATVWTPLSSLLRAKLYPYCSSIIMSLALDNPRRLIYSYTKKINQTVKLLFELSPFDFYDWFCESYKMNFLKYTHTHTHTQEDMKYVLNIYKVVSKVCLGYQIYWTTHLLFCIHYLFFFFLLKYNKNPILQC